MHPLIELAYAIRKAIDKAVEDKGITREQATALGHLIVDWVDTLPTEDDE